MTAPDKGRPALGMVSERTARTFAGDWGPCRVLDEAVPLSDVQGAPVAIPVVQKGRSKDGEMHSYAARSRVRPMAPFGTCA